MGSAGLVWMSDLFFFQAEDGIRVVAVTGVQTCALPISPLERSRSDAPHPQGLARLARVGTQSSRSARRRRCAYVRRATCDVPPVFGRSRLRPQLQAPRRADGLLPPARRPRASARRVASVPAGSVTMVDRSAPEFRSALELYDRASLLELGALAAAARWKLHPQHVATYMIDRNIHYTNGSVPDRQIR